MTNREGFGNRGGKRPTSTTSHADVRASIRPEGRGRNRKGSLQNRGNSSLHDISKPLLPPSHAYSQGPSESPPIARRSEGCRWALVASEHGPVHSTRPRSSHVERCRQLPRVRRPVLVPVLLLQPAPAVPDRRRRAVRRRVVQWRVVRRREVA